MSWSRTNGPKYIPVSQRSQLCYDDQGYWLVRQYTDTKGSQRTKQELLVTGSNFAPIDIPHKSTLALGIMLSPHIGFPSVPFGAKFYVSGSTFTTDYNPACPLTEGAPGVSTYYIDKATGNDSNPGTASQPFKTFYKAATIGRSEAPNMLLKVKGGTYLQAENLGSFQNQALKLAVVPWDGAPIICTNEIPMTGASWTLDTGATYYASLAGYHYAEYNSTVWDGAFPDAWGDHKPLLPAATLADCRATAGTFFLDDPSATRIYVHTQDGRAPDANIHVFEANGAPGAFVDFAGSPASTELYVEGITFLGGAAAFYTQQKDNVNVTKAIFKNCTMKYSKGNYCSYVSGNVLVAHINCVVAKSYGDCISYEAYAGPSPVGLEINCEARGAGCTLTNSISNQGSTMHGGTIVRLNGFYHHNQNDQIADVGTMNSWNIGCRTGASLQSGFAGYRCGNGPAGSNMTLEGCLSSGTTYDIISDTGSAVYQHNFIGAATNSGAGAITAL